MINKNNIAFSTVACMKEPYTSIINFLKNNDVKGLEIRLDQNGKVFGLEGDSLQKCVNEIYDNGLIITDIGTNSLFNDYDENVITKTKRYIDLISEIGVKAIRVFPGHFQKKISEYKDNPSDINGMTKALIEVCDYAKEKDKEIWFETHNEFSCSKEVKEIIEKVNRDNFKIILDVIHPLELGESIAEFVNNIGEKIAHVHIKDGKYSKDPDRASWLYTKLGKGDIKLEDIILPLDSINYKGYLSLEWEAEWRDEIKELYNDYNSLIKDFKEYLN